MYFILTIRDTQEARCPGYYCSLNRARQAVENNYCDMFECGYYKYAVILYIRENCLYPDPQEWAWYSCDIDDNVEKIERPVELSNYYPYILG